MITSATHISSVGIYIHIPFCLQKCGYCDFYSLPLPSHSGFADEFVTALEREIKIRADTELYSFPVDTIYLGGGTPSLLTDRQVGRIFAAIRKNFIIKPSAEITIEVNPGTAKETDFKQFLEVGINRVSLGVQALNDDLLKRLGRIHSAKEAEKAFHTVRVAGFSNVSVDLIFGIPGQTLKEWQHTLSSITTWQAEHLSVYNLTYEQGTPFFQLREIGDIVPVPETEESEMFLLAMEILKHKGYEQYELSNYARSGYACRHNIRYWEHLPYIGFGPSAHSFVKGRRRWNRPNLKDYLENLRRFKEPPHQQEELTQTQLLEEWIFLQLRQTKGLELSSLAERFHLKADWSQLLHQTFGNKWGDFFELENGHLRFTPQGMLLSDSLLPALLHQISKKFSNIIR